MESIIYILYTCNEWKEYNSMCVNSVGTSPEKLLKRLQKGVKLEVFECENEQLFNETLNTAFHRNYKGLKDEFIELISSFNKNLKFCHIQLWQNGKQIA